MKRDELRESIASELEDELTIFDERLIEPLIQIAESYAKSERERLAATVKRWSLHQALEIGETDGTANEHGRGHHLGTMDAYDRFIELVGGGSDDRCS